MSGAPESFWAELPLGRGVTLLKHDANGVAAFNKPAGVLSHPNERGEEARALLTTRYDLAGEFFEWEAGESEGAGGSRRLWLLNRLDSATSGVILAAADETLAREIRAQFKRRSIRKVYQALVFGVPTVPAQFWRDRLAVQKRAGMIRTGSGHIPAETQMTLVRRGAGAAAGRALLKLEPHTGRSHQLRVQCAKRHLPIVGDATYGDFRRNREFARATGEKRLFLHSLETAFTYAAGGRSFSFSAQAPLPEAFRGALQSGGQRTS